MQTSAKNYDTTLARIAGNIASGMAAHHLSVLGPWSSQADIDREQQREEQMATRSLRIAQAIVDQCKRLAADEYDRAIGAARFSTARHELEIHEGRQLADYLLDCYETFIAQRSPQGPDDELILMWRSDMAKFDRRLA